MNFPSLVSSSFLLLGAVAFSSSRSEVESPESGGVVSDDGGAVVAGSVPAFVRKGLSWLAEAQHEDGGWGGGSHANQRERDPHAVRVDPGTTAFTAMAFLRAGHSFEAGEYRETVRRATDLLLEVVEAADAAGPKVTDVVGTQPQAKMGPFVDTALCAQFFARALADVDGDSTLGRRLAAARDKCLRKIEATQEADGSWGKGGWAPVLQSSLMRSALELGAVSGGEVARDRLVAAGEYQMGQVDLESGEIESEAAAGIALYASAGNMRAVAGRAKAAADLVEAAKREGRVDGDAAVDEETLRRSGATREEAKDLALAVRQNEAAKERAFDDGLLKGFGNNGGEEFLSYLMSSESLVIDGGAEWGTWREKMLARMEKIQNGDGSWSGHHCITSPVFCTAAVTLCLTADRDVELLRRAARLDVPDASEEGAVEEEVEERS